MKTLTKIATLLFTLVLSTATTAAHACGEVMYRMGGALRYHAFITHNPAEILLYQGPLAPQHSDAERAQFHDNLEKAGHKVTVLTDPDALSQTLATHSYDVIIASAADMDVIAAQIAKAAHRPVSVALIEDEALRAGDVPATAPRTWVIRDGLALAVVAYDFIPSRWTRLLLMPGCRFLNVFLGLSAADLTSVPRFPGSCNPTATRISAAAPPTPITSSSPNTGGTISAAIPCGDCAINSAQSSARSMAADWRPRM